MANWNEEDFMEDPPDTDGLSGERTTPDASYQPQSGSADWPAVVIQAAAMQAAAMPEANPSPSAGAPSAEAPSAEEMPTAGPPSAEETFRRLANLHRQMLEKQYNNAAFRSELERMGLWIRNMDAHLEQLAHVETLAEQHRALLNDMLTNAQNYRQVLLDDMAKHQKTIGDALKAMGNPLKKLDDLLEEQTRSFQTFSSVVNKIWWIFLSAALSGALVGNLVASVFHF
ncbi:MAG: hypothetical protein M0003_09320 [Acidithiobacillus sp.]|nr:hypothetical protein [Acidithiobacillus sp.]